ncbi:MAG: DEAD/DEAH box helicase family protein, partial [Planctomycetes bacterium]|nr:DEAD/DEAH box helicase family protein [Planctomycetota bacterium]
GARRDGNADILFASVQSIVRHSPLYTFNADDFDYLIVDEFHHASATMYRRILNHFKPRYMLGLTATPERSDGLDILNLCDGNLVYECPLLRGIEEDYLCPFHYFGILDAEVDYSSIPWRNGKFDEGELEKMVATQARADHTFREWQEKGGQKTLAFCVSRRHADFMAEYFREQGIACVSVHSTSEIRRKEAMDGLAQGKYKIVFSVDLFNEGFDLPGIDTVMMLRPTESNILFLQQLGRGLRKSQNKEKLVVLDYIGNHRSFLNRPRLLLGIEANLATLIVALKQIREGKYPEGLPKGCELNYDLGVIDFFEQCLHLAGERASMLYLHFRDTHGRRPSAREMFEEGAPMPNIRNSYGSWFSFVAKMEDLDDEAMIVLAQSKAFLIYLETTNMTRCFKMVLLETLVNHGGLVHPMTLENLAMKSWKIFEKRPEWKSDIREDLRDLANWNDQSTWVRYWRDNPINAYVNGKFFRIEEDRFVLNFDLPEDGLDILEGMIRELIELRQAQYWVRYQVNQPVTPVQTKASRIRSDISPDERYTSFLPFYPIKIAAGSIEDSGVLPEPESWFDTRGLISKRLNKTLFVAQVTGDSMEPRIPNQSYCLFSAEIGGSKNGELILVHLPSQMEAEAMGSYLIKKYRSEKSFDESGDFLHTKVVLESLNPKYLPIIIEGEKLKSFCPLARFVEVLENPDD